MEQKICAHCGSAMPLNSKFCTECGTPFPQEDQPAKPQENPAEQPAEETSVNPQSGQPMNNTPPVYADPVYNTVMPPYSPEITKESVEGTKYEPISSLGWLGIFLLVGIPVIGPLLVIIWACCGCRKVNKRTFARGMLLKWLLIAIITALTLLALKTKIVNAAKDYADQHDIPYSEDSAIEDILEGFLSQQGYEIED